MPTSTPISRGSAAVAAATGAAAAGASGRPQQCLNFLPLPHGHGSLRPGLMLLSVVPVAALCVPERALQRLEPRREILPLVEALAIDRLSHLLGARRAHAAPVLVERYALRLELQAAELQQAAHAALEIVHHVLVVHAQHPAPEHAVPVPHELEVGAVVTGDLLDAVREFLAVGEELLEVAEAAGHRLAPGIDDAGVREHEVDQADVPEVVRHLVDEEGLAGTIDARAGKVFLAELAEILRRERREHARVARIILLGAEAPQAAHDLLHVRQLLGAFDLRVRGQDLLEQRRARARKPDDEDGLAARMAPTRAAGEELRGTDPDLLLRVAFDQLGPVAAFGALELVTQPVVVERACKVSLV